MTYICGGSCDGADSDCGAGLDIVRCASTRPSLDPPGGSRRNQASSCVKATKRIHVRGYMKEDRKTHVETIHCCFD